MAGQARLRLFYESMKAEKVAERQLIRKNKAVPFTYRDVSVEHEVVGDNLSTLITDLKKFVFTLSQSTRTLTVRH